MKDFCSAGTRAQAKHLHPIIDRSLDLPQMAEGICAVDVGLDLARIEPQRLVEVLDRLGVLAER